MWFHKCVLSINCKKYNNRRNSSMLLDEQHSKVGEIRVFLRIGKVLFLDLGTYSINVFSLWKFVDTLYTCLYAYDVLIKSYKNNSGCDRKTRGLSIE